MQFDMVRTTYDGEQEKHFVTVNYESDVSPGQGSHIIISITRIPINGGALHTINKVFDTDAGMLGRINKMVQLDNELFTMVSELGR